MGRLPAAPGWLRRRDPHLVAVHRALRVTLAACAGFYVCRYALHDATTATYALFAVVATGVLSQLGGGPKDRARTLLAVLPAAYALVTTGTLLAVQAWSAALGMLVVGFAVAYGSVGGPRLVGLANGLQLFYILPCFPPYQPGALPSRLAGVTVGLLLLAGAELVLWPERTPVRYQDRLARAADMVARLADSAADACTAPRASAGATDLDDPDPAAAPTTRATDPDPGRGAGAGGPLAASRAAVDGLRPSLVPVLERPASAGAVDRALTHSAAALRYTRTQLARVVTLGVGAPTPETATLLRATARALRAAAPGVGARAPAPDPAPVQEAIADFETARAEPAQEPWPATPEAAEAKLRLGCIALDAAEGARFLLIAVRISRRAPVPPDPYAGDRWRSPFWYAELPARTLWWRRFRGHLTPRSVYFQNALRTAAALAAARLVAGALDLSHGFWALLATLTLMRTCAADTRMTLRPALTGTLLGALATAPLLFAVGERPAVYAAVLPVAMLIAFTAGPLLGVAWGQGMFTVVVAMIFTQLAPADWRLAETRLIDVVIGAAVGTLAGLCAWPRGGGSELRRSVADLLCDSALALQETVAVVTGNATGTGALRRAQHTLTFAEASYAQFQTERHDPVTAGPNWQAALLACQHTTRGAEQLLTRCPPGSLAPWPRTVERLERDAALVAGAFQQQSHGLRRRSRPDHAELRLAETEEVLLGERTLAAHPPADPLLLTATDLSVWLSGLLDDLAAVSPPGAEPARAPDPVP
ncbi:putative membrane protein YccC [Kitasatospora herbaricolor]|uniref:FUSC family protein n=1 Tax=Kitasatospora herbaricolor TaxID=68217 RepID=UPI00174E3618|nr:FUSC family protein [Kitasatospora herbaricolor]MDQ0313519.1 putative membrane protein YccC [Kitasatospora herbaricolor]